MYYSIITGFGFSVFLGNQTEDVVCTAFFIWSFKVSQSPFFTKLTKIVDGEKELQEEKTFSIFIQTDYVNTKWNFQNCQNWKKTQIGLQPNTSPAPMYVFANVHLLEFFVRDTNV